MNLELIKELDYFDIHSNLGLCVDGIDEFSNYSIAYSNNVKDWLNKMKAEDERPYLKAKPIKKKKKLAEVLSDLQEKGYTIAITTWLSKNSSKEFKEKTRTAKKEWLNSYKIPYDKFHGIQYGATKANSVRKYSDSAVLIDDNPTVRNGWSLGATVDPTKVDIIKFLEGLL